MNKSKSIMGMFVEKYNINNLNGENLERAIDEYKLLELEYNSLSYTLEKSEFLDYSYDILPMIESMQIAYTKAGYLMSLFNELGINPIGENNIKRK